MSDLSETSPTNERAPEAGGAEARIQQLSQAAEEYYRALEQSPDDPELLAKLGETLIELRDHTAAQPIFQKLAAATPDDPGPQLQLAQLAERQYDRRLAARYYLAAAERQLKNQQLDAALDSWQQAQRLDPDNLESYARLALAYERLGRRRMAVHQYLGLASLLQAANNRENALQAVQRAVRLAPNVPDVRWAAEMLRAGQPLPPATRWVSASGSVRPPVRLETGEQAIHQDPIQETLRYALTQLSDMLYEVQEDLFVLADKPRRGLNALVSGSGPGVEEAPDSARALRFLSQALSAQQRQYDLEAAADLDRSISCGLRHPAAYYNLGYLLSRKDPERALNLLQKALPHEHYALGAYLLMAQIVYNQKDYTAASQYFLRALRLADALTVAPEQVDRLTLLYEPFIDEASRQQDPEASKAVCDYISDLLLRPSWRKALKQGREKLTAPQPLAGLLIKSRAEEVVAGLDAVRELAAQGHYRSAMEDAFLALQRTPTFLPLHLEIGELLLLQGDTAAAVEKFMLVARLYILRGDNAQAIQILQRILELAPADLNARRMLVDLLRQQGSMLKAVQQSLELADMYYQRADLAEAREAVRAALEMAQSEPKARPLLVTILNKLGDLDLQRLEYRQALASYEQLREMQPDAPGPRRRLASIHFRIGQDSAALEEVDDLVQRLEEKGQHNQAIQFLLSLVEDFPRHMDLRMRLAQLYRRAGMPEQAAEQLVMLADALAATGDYPEARRLLEAALELHPDWAIRERLEELE